MRQYILLCFLFISFALSAAVYVPTTVPNPKTQGQDYYVSNPDNILNNSSVSQLNSLCANLNQQTTVDLAIVAIEAMDENKYYVEKFAQELFNYWGIGNSSNNNGVLILLVVNSRDIRIQTGGGAEGILPDAVCSQIIYNKMVPYLQNNDWDNGIMAGTRAICDELAKDEHRAELILGTQYVEVGNLDWIFNWFIIGCIVMILSTIPILQKNKWKPQERNKIRYKKAQELNEWLIILALCFPLPMIFVSRWWRKKATKKYFLDKPFICPNCNHGEMKQLPANEVTTLLNPNQKVEMEIKSVSYEFWQCQECGTQRVYRDVLSCQYKQCSVCGAVADKITSRNTILSATTSRAGKGEATYTCKNCGYSHVEPFIIPMIVPKPTVRTSSWGGSRSSSGWGGSRGSWGGGSSFGGGASGKF